MEVPLLIIYNLMSIPTCSGLQKQTEGDAESIDEDVASRLAQTLVELATLMDASHLEPCEEVKHEIDERQDE